MARLMGPLKRSTMTLSFLFQATLCFAAIACVLTGLVPNNAGSLLPDNCIVLFPLALLSFQSAGQIVMSRMLGYNEIPTVVLTSTYTDLFMDPKLLTAPLTTNSKRNRRAVSAVALLLGATLGGFLTEGGSIVDPLWITAALKIVLAGMWVFWQGKGTIRLD
jgi:Protein of unknown function (DUF1275)